MCTMVYVLEIDFKAKISLASGPPEKKMGIKASNTAEVGCVTAVHVCI